MWENNIKHFRSAMGLTVRALADKTNLRPGTISDAENGKIIPRADTLRAIADALHCSMDDLCPYLMDCAASERYADTYLMAGRSIAENGVAVLKRPVFKVAKTLLIALPGGWVNAKYLTANDEIVAELGPGAPDWYPIVGEKEFYK